MGETGPACPNKPNKHHPPSHLRPPTHRYRPRSRSHSYSYPHILLCPLILTLILVQDVSDRDECLEVWWERK